MAQRTHLTDAEKRLIVKLSQDGMKAKQISAAAGVKLASVYTLLRRQKLQGTTGRAKGSGKPRKLTPRVLRILKRIIVLNRRATLAELTSSLPVMIHRNTVRRALRRMCYRSRVA